MWSNIIYHITDIVYKIMFILYNIQGIIFKLILLLYNIIINILIVKLHLSILYFS